MEQVVATLSQEDQLYNSVVKPLTIKDVTLLAPGIWTGVDGRKTRYSPEAVRNGFLNTNWEGMNLFLDHKDTEGPAAAYWIGFIKNSTMVGEELHGDLEIWHPMFAMFVKTAKANFGVSMTMNGREDFNNGADYSDFEINSYRSGSLVDEPGCEVSWLPKMLGKGDKNSKTVIGGNVSLENIKSLALNNHSSKKSLESNDSEISGSSDSEEHSDEGDNCKEVKQMKEKVNQEKSEEEQKEEVTTEEESKEESKEKTESESSTEAKDKENVKELAAKLDKLSADVSALTGLVQKSLAAGEESKEKSEEESKEESKEKTEDESKDDELESTKSELEETKKELAKVKAEANELDEKSLAAGTNSANVGDSNAGMLGFLQKNAHLD